MAFDLKFKMKNESEWATENPTFRPGEVAIVLDTGEFVIGDGFTTFNNLPRIVNQNKVKIWENGVTGNRPSSPAIGQRYFDTTLGKPIWYNGTNWVDANGAIV